MWYLSEIESEAFGVLNLTRSELFDITPEEFAIRINAKAKYLKLTHGGL